MEHRAAVRAALGRRPRGRGRGAGNGVLEGLPRPRRRRALYVRRVDDLLTGRCAKGDFVRSMLLPATMLAVGFALGSQTYASASTQVDAGASRTKRPEQMAQPFVRRAVGLG